MNKIQLKELILEVLDDASKTPYIQWKEGHLININSFELNLFKAFEKANAIQTNILIKSFPEYFKNK